MDPLDLVLDILVATLVTATGLVMLPPSLVSLPLKLLVFVAADGWSLVIRALRRDKKLSISRVFVYKALNKFWTNLVTVRADCWPEGDMNI